MTDMPVTTPATTPRPEPHRPGTVDEPPHTEESRIAVADDERSEETGEGSSPNTKADSGALALARRHPGRTAAIAAGTIAAVAGTGYALFRRFSASSRPTPPADREPAVYHLVGGPSGWQLRPEGSEEAEYTYETRRKAVSAARRFARENRPSRLVIHRADGTIQRHHSYGC